MARAFALPVFAFVALGCSRGEPGDFWLVLREADDSGVQLAHAEVTPESALLERHAEWGGVRLRLRRDVGPVRVSAPGGCPLVVAAPQASLQVVERQVDALFELGPVSRVIGPARRFEIRARPRCSEAERSRVELRVGRGAALDDVRLGDGGRTLSAATRGIERAKGASGRGIVPVAASERGVTQIVAHIRQPDGFSIERQLEVVARARASGLPSVALGHGVLLEGPGFRIENKPEGSRAELRTFGDFAELVPDVRGHFALADALGRKLVIQSGRYDEMPLDCGRSDCHRSIAAGVRESPMTHALRAGLGGNYTLAFPECAVACHATGEPGTDDGGFSHVQEELGLSDVPATWNELPRALRRLGGVGCLACHGPTAIPPESARWSVLRSDLCAVCHDAPPRYGHVAAFASTKMAKADRNAATREGECARCHTAWGSLADPARRPPPEAGALGIGCVACHDVHPTSEVGATRPSRGLLRAVNVHAVLPGAPAAAEGPSRVCIDCHSPGTGPLPIASAAAVWAGRGGLDPETGSGLDWPAPHAKNGTGCLHCHNSGPEGLERGTRHAFQVSWVSCVRCHDEPPKRNPELATRARAVLDALVPLARGRTRSVPIHAETLEARLPDDKSRALRNVLLVLEDRAADVHNPAYAEVLVSSAEKASGMAKSPKRFGEEAPP